MITNKQFAKPMIFSLAMMQAINLKNNRQNVNNQQLSVAALAVGGYAISEGANAGFAGALITVGAAGLYISGTTTSALASNPLTYTTPAGWGTAAIVCVAAL
jgi:hypothetical protein